MMNDVGMKNGKGTRWLISNDYYLFEPSTTTYSNMFVCDSWRYSFSTFFIHTYSIQYNIISTITQCRVVEVEILKKHETCREKTTLESWSLDKFRVSVRNGRHQTTIEQYKNNSCLTDTFAEWKKEYQVLYTKYKWLKNYRKTIIVNRSINNCCNRWIVVLKLNTK